MKAYVFKAVAKTPLASQGTYDQQYQMYRFVTEYLQERVAIDHIAQQKSIAVATIYSQWFAGNIPDRWCKIAQLTTPKYSAAGDKVDFYLINPEKKQRVYTALSQFSASLPIRDSLKVFGC